MLLCSWMAPSLFSGFGNLFSFRTSGFSLKPCSETCWIEFLGKWAEAKSTALLHPSWSWARTQHPSPSTLLPRNRSPSTANCPYLNFQFETCSGHMQMTSCKWELDITAVTLSSPLPSLQLLFTQLFSSPLNKVTQLLLYQYWDPLTFILHLHCGYYLHVYSFLWV